MQPVLECPGGLLGMGMGGGGTPGPGVAERCQQASTGAQSMK